MKAALRGIGITLLLAVVLFLFMAPSLRMPRAHQPFRVCYANLRVLLGAIEMYNMDHSTMIKTLGPSDLVRLEAGRYLKSSIACPGDNLPRFRNSFLQALVQQMVWISGLDIQMYFPVPPGVYLGRDLDTTGRPSCSLHGTVD